MSVSKSTRARDPNQRQLPNWDRVWGKTTRWVILLFTVWKFSHLTVGLTARVIKGTRLKFQTLLSQPEKTEIWFTQDSPVQWFFSILSPSAIAKHSHLVISNATISNQCVSKTWLSEEAFSSVSILVGHRIFFCIARAQTGESLVVSESPVFLILILIFFMNNYSLAKSPNPLQFNIYIICWSTEFEDRNSVISCGFPGMPNQGLWSYCPHEITNCLCIDLALRGSGQA